MTEYDAIVVGAGLAGSSSAIKLAQQGHQVALIDRGNPVGSKNLSGGVLWGNDLSEIIPNWMEEAPVERYITSKRVGFLTETDSMIIDWRFQDWGSPPYNGVSVLRAKFDKWLAEKAEEAGVHVYQGINVDDLLVRDGRVKGIIQDGDEFETNVVVIADGANSRLTLSAGLKRGMYKKHYMLGVKEVLSLPKDRLEERFQLQGKEGVSYEFVLGFLPSPVKAGGFFYTNKETLSMGVVVNLDSLVPGIASYEIFELFKRHPTIQRLVHDASIIEYGAHLIPTGGLEMVPKIYGDGYVIVGDAAGFCFSNGLVIHGMGPAIRSGIEAGKAVHEALSKNDTSANALKRYESYLEKTYVLENLKRFKNIKKLTKNPRLYHGYPDVLVNTFKEMFTDTGKAKEHLSKIGRKELKKQKISMVKFLSDAFSGGRAI